MELPKVAGYSLEEIYNKIEERKSICGSCEHLTIMRTCEKCGCFMPVKILIPFINCPIGKWGFFEKREEKNDL